MNILGMGPMELVLIVVLALIVFGPAKLPEIMGQVGKAIADFRRVTSELSDEFNRTIQAELQETRSVIDQTKSAVSDVHATVNSAVTGVAAPVRTALPGEGVSSPVANGVSAAAPMSNGVSAPMHTDSGTNGTAPTQSIPPLADTTQWSWETSAPNPPVAETPPPTSPAAASAVPNLPETAAPSNPDTSVPATSPQAQQRAARDELVPPY